MLPQGVVTAGRWHLCVMMFSLYSCQACGLRNAALGESCCYQAAVTKLHAHAVKSSSFFPLATNPCARLQYQRVCRCLGDWPHLNLKRAAKAQLVCKAGRDKAWLLSECCSAGSGRGCGTEARLAGLCASVPTKLWHGWPGQPVRIREVCQGLEQSSLAWLCHTCAR